MVINGLETYSEIENEINKGAFKRADLEENQLIYHYTSIDNMKNIIDNNCFWATEYRYLNDEDEFSYSKEIFISTLKDVFKIENVNEKLRRFCENIYDRFEIELLNDYYVISFSLNQDNLTLWSEFANPGCCIGFVLRKLVRDNSFYTCCKVEYDEDVQKGVYIDGLNLIFGKYFNDPKIDLRKPENADYVKKMLINIDEADFKLIVKSCAKLGAYYGMGMKNYLFKAEEEYRVICKSNGTQNFRCARNILIPYVEMKTEELGSDQIKEVIHSPLVSDNLAIQATKKYLDSENIHDVIVKKSKLKLRF